MAEPRAAVRNAADPTQVVRAGRADKDRIARVRAAVRAMLDTVAGRIVFTELLEQAGVYQSVYHHSGSEMYYNEGRRSFGLYLRALLEDVDDGLFDTMERERRAGVKADAAAMDAAHMKEREA